MLKWIRNWLMPSFTMFSYTWDTINTGIRPKLLDFRLSRLFKGAGYVGEYLWNHKKLAKMNKFEVPLHHASDANPQGIQPLDNIEGTHGEIVNKGYDDMVMAADLVVITYEEFKSQGGADRFIDLIRLRQDGKLDGMRNVFLKSLWRRTAAVPSSTTASSQMNGFWDIYDHSNINLHDLNQSTYSVWASIQIDATSLSGTPSTRAGITDDASSDVYLLNILDKVVGNLRSRQILPGKGIISMGAAMYSALRSVLVAKDEFRPGPLTAKLGYDSAVYRGYDVVEDDWMSLNQTGDTDGWIAGISLDDVSLYVNDPKGITLSPYMGGMKQPYKGAQIQFYRQLACHARNHFVFVTNMWNDSDYLQAAIET